MRELSLVMQLSDSALPIGGFSFSSGLESAVECGVVHDEESLREYLSALVRSYASMDSVASLVAFDSAQRGDLDGVIRAEKAILTRKLGCENREMMLKMGGRLMQLALRIIPSQELLRWQELELKGEFCAAYPIVMALLFHILELPRFALFTALGFGVANLALSASLRLMRLSHYTTQRILYDVSQQLSELYDKYRSSDIGSMQQFAPQLEIVASLHEIGTKRVFMN